MRLTRKPLFLVLSLIGLAGFTACKTTEPKPAVETATAEADHYIGTATCQGCHQAAHATWSETWMSKTVRKPHPDELALIQDSILCGGLEVDYVLGGRLTLRYLQRTDEGGYIFLPCEYDAINKQVQPFRLDDWQTFSFDERCAACHTTNFDPQTTTWDEMGIGCESCHGPGSRHGDFTTPGGMVQFAEISPAQEGMICSSCHLQGGFSLKSERRYPEGYRPGMDLFAIYRFPWDELPQDKPSRMPADDNPVDVHQKILMKQQLDGTSSLRCTDCHSVHQSDDTKHQSLDRQDYCFYCHTQENENLGLKDYQVSCPVCEF